MIIKQHSLPVIGAILGDMVGAPYELKGHRIKKVDFPFLNEESTFTDDTVLTLAIANWLVDRNTDLCSIVHSMGRDYINVGFGHSFKKWLRDSNPQPYNSYGNGSAMRVSAIGAIANTITEAMNMAKDSAMITHNHPEGIKGAQAVAVAVFLAYNGFTQQNIKEYIENQFGYNLSRKIANIRDNYDFDATCEGSVPEAIIAFLESKSVEDAIRLAVSLGGDSDTQASIAGAIAAAYFKEIPSTYIDKVLSGLSPNLMDILEHFNNYVISLKSSPNFIFIAQKDTTLTCYIRYTFALAVTDLTRVFIPKGTKLMFNWNRDNRKGGKCRILSNKEQIFSIIEKQLRKEFADVISEYDEYLCNGICVELSEDDLDSFIVRETNTEDILCKS